MATAESVFPKVGNDPLFDSEVNEFAGFGDGTDGAFSETSGTTNLTQGTIHQYTSFLLDTNATLSASSTSDKPIIILVSGDCTINGTINLKGKGLASSAGYYSNIRVAAEDTRVLNVGSSGGNGGDPSGTIQGARSMKTVNFDQNIFTIIINGTGGGNGGQGPTSGFSGGGGGGCSTSNDGSDGERAPSGGGGAGTGGEGGCTLFLIIGGDLTFGASSTIDVSGNDGGDQTLSGGGGGGSGDILIFHNGTLTDNGVTKTKNGGAKGVDTTDGNADGGAGAAGKEKIVAFDTIFWG